MDSFYAVMEEGTFPWVMFCISMFGSLIALLLAIGIIPKFGPLKKAFAEAKENVEVGEMEDSGDGKLIDFIIPVIILLVMVLIFRELIIATLAAIAACFLMYIPRKIMTLSEFSGTFVQDNRYYAEIDIE